MKNSGLFVICLIVIVFTSCIQNDVINEDNTPQGNFSLLWNIVDESYCFFEEKGIDWDSIKLVYEPQIYNTMPDTQLFRVCGNMLNELKDGHVNLYSDFNVSRYWDWYLDYPQNYNATIVERNYLGDDYFLKGGLRAKNLNGIGYVRYTSFDNNISYSDMYQTLGYLGNIDGLIIDIRNNGGGYVSEAESFASCFFSEKTLVGYIKYKEGKGHSDFSDYYELYINPDSVAIFDGPIVVLTNRLVYSAANYFVSMMQIHPNAVQIGDISGGGGGLPFSSELYNGWSVRLSRNPNFDIDKKSIESGVAPDIYIDMDVHAETNGIDSMIEYAINYLKNQSD